VALDIGLGTVRIARAIGAEHKTPLLGIVGDVEHLPFRSGAFEAVVSGDTVEHLPDDRLGVAELARVSRPGAPLVLATPNRHDAFILRRRFADRLRGRRRPVEHYFVSNSHLREYTWREFERLVTGAARIHGRVGVGWETRAGSWKSRLLSRLVRRPPFRLVCQMIVVEARR
jgi:SAM-dependent methyltransferase